jgi:hypothetical protein
MKIVYDYPSYVNDVLIISWIVIHGVKQKKNPHIKNFKPYFSKLFNYIQPTQKVEDFMLTLCTQNQNL